MFTVSKRTNWLLTESGTLDSPTVLEVNTFFRGDQGPLMPEADSRVTTPVGKAFAHAIVPFVELEVMEKFAAREICGGSHNEQKAAQARQSPGNETGSLYIWVRQ